MQYFDHNATTPLSSVARDAWLATTEQFPGNPSSPHRMGSRADHALTEARNRLAEMLGASPLDLVWTSGATEAANMVFHHYSEVLDPSDLIWVSAIEHPCVLESARRSLGDRVKWIPVSSEGKVEVSSLDSALAEGRPKLVVVMAANNETGVIQPWQRISEWCDEHEIDYFCDAAQWLGKYPAKDLGRCEWTIGCAHKFGGPKGVGFLKCPSNGSIRPLLAGGPQEISRRAGTENVAGAVSMVAALTEREDWLNATPIQTLETLRQSIEKRILETVPGTRIIGPNVDRLWNTVSLVMPDCDCRFRWVVKLDRLGFAVSTGSACSSGKEKPSHVLEAMEITSEEAGRVIRCSSGPETVEADWLALVDALVDVGHEAQQLSSR